MSFEELHEKMSQVNMDEGTKRKYSKKEKEALIKAGEQAHQSEMLRRLGRRMRYGWSGRKY